MKPSDFLTELSTEKLAQYKTAAAADASKADKAGDFKKGDKRFSGIVKATKKQFANDEKKVGESAGLPSPLISRPSPMLVPTVICGARERYGSWKMYCTSRRNFFHSSTEVTGIPS